jgi:hypothetical protein
VAKSASTIRLRLARPHKGEAGQIFAAAKSVLERIGLVSKGLARRATPRPAAAGRPATCQMPFARFAFANRARSFSTLRSRSQNHVIELARASWQSDAFFNRQGFFCWRILASWRHFQRSRRAKFTDSRKKRSEVGCGDAYVGPATAPTGMPIQPDR